MQNRLSDKELLANLKRLVLEAELNKSEAEILEEYKNTPDVEIDAFLKRVKQLNFQANIALRKKKFELASKIKQMIESSSEGFEDLLARLSSNPKSQPAVALFRKFKGMDENEMNAMLADQQLLELIAQLNLDEDDK